MLESVASSFIVIGYDASLQDALRSFVEVSQMDVTKLSQEVIFNAIMKQ